MNILRLPEVSKKLGMGKSTIYRILKNDPHFPKPFRLTSDLIVWDVDDLDKWLVFKKGDSNGP